MAFISFLCLNRAILTILQIQGAGNDPLTRNFALFSLICALMSLLYGCMYIVRFGTIRHPHKAAAWAEVSCAGCSMYIPVLIIPTGRSEVYNIHLVECLGSPRNASNLARLVGVYRPSFICAMFLISSRSIILYIACILSFVWRAGTTNHERTYVLSPRAELGIRIAFSAVFGLGVVYFTLIIRTFWQYGDAIDESLKAKVCTNSRKPSRSSIVQCKHMGRHTLPIFHPL